MTSWELFHRDPDCEGWEPRYNTWGAFMQVTGAILLEDSVLNEAYYLLEDDTDGTAAILLEDA